jgi:type I restriction enzyme M protein
MLDSETKNRINTARDILVGKVPDPKSQVEQITIALIYKFMDDMDVESEEMGGKRTFFSGEFSKYAWRKIFDPRQSGHELLNLYSEAIAKMDTNPGMPKLFRDIFKNAYLPYRDPETLKSFLKIINEFEYSHSEKLGDAFEFLLSILGSQGDAGQFRTPRHIIDFMVAIIDPKKHEIILDPACGTAGFLISSYKHIIKQNSSNYTPDEDPGIAGNGTQTVNEVIITSNGYSGDKLTANERSVLADNMHGYDISPDMVRLSLVNMYLHGIKEPQIFEYDTLTSEDHWNEYSDVILANPPFMSPKGGIRPHKRFSVQSNRSEVLFVDYIAEHLTQDGKAAVIVPEGIIFQSGNAYKQLRKMLVDKYLVGVISLPAGVFNPYSGVKTSILWLDKTLAKKTDKILFIKIENDGFDLGAQRRAIKGNDLPTALEKISDYKTQIISGKLTDFGSETTISLVARNDIADNGEYNLSGDRYKKHLVINSDFPIVSLSDIAEVIAGQSPRGEFYNEVAEGLPFYQGKTEFGKQEIENPRKWTTQITKEAFKGDILMSVRAPVGPVNLNNQHICIGRGLAAIRVNEKIKRDYLFYLLKSKQDDIKGNGGAVFDSISKNQIEAIQIPLPPLSIQEEIVSEIDSYQKIIDGARQVVENYKPHIDINPEWEMVELGKVCEELTDGSHFSPETTDTGYSYITVRDLTEGNIDFANSKRISKEDFEKLVRSGCKPRKNDILFSKDGTVGKTALVTTEKDFVVLSSLAILTPDTKTIIPEYLYHILSTDWFISKAIDNKTGVAIKRIVLKTLKTIMIPLPDFSTQKRIADTINNEIQLINSNKSLIHIYEQKIKDRIAKVWGE